MAFFEPLKSLKLILLKILLCFFSGFCQKWPNICTNFVDFRNFKRPKEAILTIQTQRLESTLQFQKIARNLSWNYTKIRRGMPNLIPTFYMSLHMDALRKTEDKSVLKVTSKYPIGDWTQIGQWKQDPNWAVETGPKLDSG